jgi:hypothetical protein
VLTGLNRLLVAADWQSDQNLENGSRDLGQWGNSLQENGTNVKKVRTGDEPGWLAAENKPLKSESRTW